MQLSAAAGGSLSATDKVGGAQAACVMQALGACARPCSLQFKRNSNARMHALQALAALEGNVRALLCSASAAVQAQQLAAEEVAALARQGASLAGGCASLCSRLRAVQDALAQLRG